MKKTIKSQRLVFDSTKETSELFRQAQNIGRTMRFNPLIPKPLFLAVPLVALK